MHLLYLGTMNWIVKQVLVGPGVLNKRRPNDQDPQLLFNDCLSAMWMPKNYQRLPPKVCDYPVIALSTCRGALIEAHIPHGASCNLSD